MVQLFPRNFPLFKQASERFATRPGRNPDYYYTLTEIRENFGEIVEPFFKVAFSWEGARLSTIVDALSDQIKTLRPNLPQSLLNKFLGYSLDELCNLVCRSIQEHATNEERRPLHPAIAVITATRNVIGTYRSEWEQR